MTEITLMNGLVTLDEMGQRGILQLLAETPAILLSIYVLVPLRLEKRLARLVPLGTYVIFCVSFLICHLTALPRPITGIIGYVLTGLLGYAGIPLFCAKYRDFRTVFLLVTVALMFVQSNALSWLLVGQSSSFTKANLLTSLFVLVFLFFFVRFYRASIWTVMERQREGWVPFSSIPFLLCGAIILFRSYPDPLAPGNAIPAGVVLVLSLELVVYRVLFDSINAREERARLNQDLALFELQTHMAEEQARQLEHRLRAGAIARHDRRHLQKVILAHLDAGDAEGAKQILRDQLAQGKQEAVSYCADPVLNQLLAYYAQLAKEEEVDFAADVHLPGDRQARRPELMVTLCNTLENAIHASARIPAAEQRRVRLTMHAKGKQVYVEVFNTYWGTLTLNPDTGLPSTDVPGHGYGLESISALASEPPSCFAKDGGFTIWMLV